MTHRLQSLVEGLICVQHLARALVEDDASSPSEVVAQIYLGTAIQAASPFILNNLGITHIVNATGHGTAPWEGSEVGGVGKSLIQADNDNNGEWTEGQAKDYARKLVHKVNPGPLPRRQSMTLLKSLQQSPVNQIPSDSHLSLPKKIQFLFLRGLRDTVDADISSFFLQVHNFIQMALQDESNKILIHCQAGVSRSPTLLRAHFMILGKTLDEAYNLVQHARPVIHPNRGFLKQLIDYYLDKLNGSEDGCVKTVARLQSCQPILL